VLLFDVIELELVGQLRPLRRHFVSISISVFLISVFTRICFIWHFMQTLGVNMLISYMYNKLSLSLSSL